MEKSTLNEEVKLTKNEQKVLKSIINRDKISDTSIAGGMKISQQAVNQIRSRLEKLGVITGYSPIIDFEKIGIHVLVIIGINISHKVWEKNKEWDVEQKIKKIPYIYQAYRTAGRDVSHILMLGFKDGRQRDEFLKKLQNTFEDQLDIKWSYSISVKDIILQDPIVLLYQIIDKKDFEFEELFL